jgi:hypothetical protein
MRPAELGSQKTYQGSRVCHPARAGRQTRSRAAGHECHGINGPAGALRVRRHGVALRGFGTFGPGSPWLEQQDPVTGEGWNEWMRRSSLRAGPGA